MPHLKATALLAARALLLAGLLAASPPKAPGVPAALPPQIELLQTRREAHPARRASSARHAHGY